MWTKEKIYKLLRLTEKYTKTDMVYLAKGGFWFSLNYILSILLAVFLLAAFANLIPPDVYGNYKFVFSVIGIISVFSLTGMGSAVVQSISRGFKKSFSHGHIKQLSWSMIPLFMGVVVSGYYFFQGNNLLGASFLVAGILSPLYANLSLYDSYFLGKKRFRKSATLSIIQQVFNFAVLLTALFLTDNVFVLVSVFVGSFFVTNFIFFLLAKREEVKTLEKNEPLDKELVGNAKHLSLMKVFARLATELDKVLVFHFMGAIELAIYSFAFTPVAKIGGLNVVIKKIGLPKLATIPVPTLKKTLPRKIFILMGVSLVIAVIYAVLAPFIFKIFFPKYLDSVILTQAFAGILVFTIPATVLNQVMVAHMKKKALYISQIVQPLIKIGLILALIPTFGLWGGVLAITSSHLIYFVMLFILFRRL